MTWPKCTVCVKDDKSVYIDYRLLASNDFICDSCCLNIRQLWADRLSFEIDAGEDGKLKEETQRELLHIYRNIHERLNEISSLCQPKNKFIFDLTSHLTGISITQ